MRKNLLSDFDIRPRLLTLIFMVTLFFLPLKVAVLAFYLGVGLVFSLVFSGVSVTVRTIKTILPLLIMVSILSPLFYRSGEAFFSIGNRVILTREGVDDTIRLLCRFSGISLVFFFFFSSSNGNELVDCLRWYGLPFRAALVINLTLRFIPEMMSLYKRVRDAHSLRIPETEDGSFFRRFFLRFSRLLPHLTSVLILTAKRIAPLSMSLHLRGADIMDGRSSFHPLSFGRKVIIHFSLFLIFTGGIIVCLVMNPWVW